MNNQDLPKQPTIWNEESIYQANNKFAMHVSRSLVYCLLVIKLKLYTCTVCAPFALPSYIELIYIAKLLHSCRDVFFFKSRDRSPPFFERERNQVCPQRFGRTRERLTFLLS
jgi:hypothetical protein